MPKATPSATTARTIRSRFARMTVDQASREIEDGFTSIRTALGEPSGVTRFFRIPACCGRHPVENYLASRGYMTWSVDFMADDWTRISASEVVRRALDRLEARGRGILLLHDIQPATAHGLPDVAAGAQGPRLPDRPRGARPAPTIRRPRRCRSSG